VQPGYPQLTNFESLDFCAADDQPTNGYESNRDRAERNGAYCNCAD
jgi:hypothetical protein